VTALFADCQVLLTPSAQSTFNAIVGVSIGSQSIVIISLYLDLHPFRAGKTFKWAADLLDVIPAKFCLSIQIVIRAIGIMME